MIDLNDIHGAVLPTGFLNFDYRDLESELFCRGYVLYPTADDHRNDPTSTEIVIFRLVNSFSNIHDPKNQRKVSIPESKAIVESCVYDAIGGVCIDQERQKVETIWSSVGRQNRFGLSI